MVILILIALLFSSCSFSSNCTLSCTIPADHPYELTSGKAMWHKIIFFDGKEVKSRTLDANVRTFKINVKSGGLRFVVAIPLGKLSPLGAFYEEGDEKDIRLYSEYGNFAKMLIEAAKERPMAVSNLSIRALKSSGKDIGTIDQSSFLEDLFDGVLKEERIKNAPYFHPQLDSIPNGYWLSDSVRAESFISIDDESVKLKLFAGIYNYWNKEKDLLLTLVISEDGRFYTSMDRLPELY